MRLENAMHDRDVLAGDTVDSDVARLVALVLRVDEEKEVPTVERRLHGTAECCTSARGSENDLMGERKDHAPEDDDNRRLCICDQSEAFPDHETRGEDRCKVEDLKEDLWVEWVGS